MNTRIVFQFALVVAMAIFVGTVWFFSSGSEHYARDVVKQCATEKDNAACYDQMNTLAAFMAKSNLSKALAYTEKITDTRYRGIAIKGVTGYYIQVLKLVKKTVSPEETSDVCSTLSPLFRDECINGFVDGIMEFGAPGAQYEEVLGLCRAPELSTDLQSACFSRLSYLSELFYSKDKMETVCTHIPSQFRSGSCCPRASCVPGV